ncbi:baseplate J/gp47 family protein [Endozoicomonas gorgoniicola]|uniref:Baseplate J/gp47 family protein n=1 Tax=Endozoicomonas gorgoniicola TaxID=1234144 RepID=A0ABT3MT83_9GAMM|nr:baseplate J/gp47 family protein [Endozoicomonas gorgoniicola]MCW7552596.1 baseplate J/gp47 family protein [Endozoicomonas gorgoniicola]
MAFTVIDLSQLPPPKVVEALDYEQTLSEILAELQQRYPDFSAPLESDPAYKIFEVCAYREMLLRAKINDEAQAVMLPYATDSDLDNLGALWNVKRLVIDAGDPDAIPPREKVMEKDDPYRYRIQLSMEGQTNAGTEGAYIFQSLSASGQVKDAKPKRQNDADIINTILSHEGDGTPSADLLKTVTDHLMQKHVRQLTDDLTVQGATITTYRVKADLYTQGGLGVEQVMNAARDAVQQFVESRHKLGAIVPVSGIYGALQQAGVSRVVLHEPAADITPTDVQAAYCSAIELTQKQEVLNSV